MARLRIDQGEFKGQVIHLNHDRTTLGILAELFPGRTVVGIHAVDLVWGLGTLHCLTQQQPLVRA